MIVDCHDPAAFTRPVPVELPQDPADTRAPRAAHQGPSLRTLTHVGRRRARDPMTQPHVVVLGLMGAGKSTIAERLAARLHRPWRDSDSDIEAATGRTGREVAADPAEGVDALHRLEEAVLLDALATDEPLVISAAGWVVEAARCRVQMRSRAFVVWLQAPADVLRARMATGQHRRASAPNELETLIERRTPLFQSVSDLVLDATDPPDALVAEVLSRLSRVADVGR